MSAPDKIKQLVDVFRRDLKHNKSGNYNEARVRREFIEPMFKALGWDVDNAEGKPAGYKDVLYESRVSVGGHTKLADYSFCTGGARRFFVEAKKPSVNIKSGIKPAYQLRRYAWNAKLPLSIVTDFEEFAVYDCRVKPNRDDSAATARVMYLTFEEYEERWDELYKLFSRRAIYNGALDEYAQKNKNKRGTTEVDEDFLQEIERWRERLAKSIAKNNPNLSVRDLNFAVQRTIDRIIFLRICEDRGIERNDRLQALQNGKNIYARLMELFTEADAKYNSGLFHFHAEKGRTGKPDKFTPDLSIPDDALKSIFKHLYYPDSPYEFSVMPADILGQVYEQFLGHVIELTPSGRVKVEQKPEVKKAGGVYYTPTYIVNYIVEHTVGKLLQERKVVGISRSDTPRLDQPLRVLDPACGSGSFLIVAFQYLMDWYLAHYTENQPKKWAKKSRPPIYQTNQAEWILTLDERKRILLDHIYGVDIDAQAVEVTKLSLLLKVLEGQSLEQLQLFAERVLPDLGDNIKCGNSLIGPDFYDNQQMDMLSEEERYRINVFDWREEFPQVFGTAKAAKSAKEEKGFDAVIGNPPYLKEYTDRVPFEQLRSCKRRHYYEGKMDLWYAFTCLSIDLMKVGGMHSFIATNNWITSAGATVVRRKVLEETDFLRFVDFGSFRVFRGVGIQTGVFLLQKTGKVNSVTTEYARLGVDANSEIDAISFLNDSDGNSSHRFGAKLRKQDKTFNFTDPKELNLLDKIENHGNCHLEKNELRGLLKNPEHFVRLNTFETRGKFLDYARHR